MNVVGRIVCSAFRYRASIAVARTRPMAAAACTQLNNFVQHYSAKSSKPPAETTSGGPADSAAKKSSKSTAPKVTLVGPDQAVSIVSLDEAHKISRRRDLKLVKIVDLDMKTQRPVYKLMTSAEYLEEDLKRREEKKRNKQEATVKGDKLLTVSARITEHDLQSKIQNVLKWLNKSLEVRIIISGDGEKSKQEAIAHKFELSTKDAGKIVQKRFRDHDLRFQILPIAPGTANAAEAPTASPAPPSATKKNVGQSGGSGKQQTQVDATQQTVRAFHTERTLTMGA